MAVTQKTIFVSYMHEDRPQAEEIVRQLQDLGYSVWFDAIDLQGEDHIDRPIRTAMDNAHYIVACFSRHWKERPNRYMGSEIAYAGESLARDPLRRSLIIRVALDEHELPAWFAREPLLADIPHTTPISPFAASGSVDVSAIAARVDHLEKGYWSTVLAQVSDSRCYLGLVSEAEFVASLKYSALLFDSIEIVPSDLLSNRFFKNVMIDREAAEVLLATDADGRPGIIRPVSCSRSSFGDIAERMIAKGTTHGLGSDADLIAHARMMDDLNPSRLLFNNPRFPAEYHYLLTTALERLIEERNDLYSDCAAWRSWLDQQDPETFSQTNAWHFIERTYPADRQTSLKAMSDTGYQTVLARSVGSRVTVAPDSVVPADAMHAAASPRKYGTNEVRELRSIDTAFSVLDVSRLSFRDVATLRSGVRNRRLRAALALPAWWRSREMALDALESEVSAFSAEVQEVRRRAERDSRGVSAAPAPVSLRVISAPHIVDLDPMLVFGARTVEETVVVPQGARAEDPSPLADTTASYAWPQGLHEVKLSPF